MSAIGINPSLTTMEKEDERLREELERALAKNNELEKASRKAKESMDTALQELSRIKMLEVQIGQTLNSLTKKRTHLEETLIKTSHSFDKLIHRTD